MIRFIFLIVIFINLLFANNTALEKVSLQLKWKHQFQFAGYYIAKEKGFYKDVGLDVTIKDYDYGVYPAKEVVSNPATYGIGEPSLIKLRSQGKPVKLIAAIFQSHPGVLIASPNSGIKTLKDIKGKNVMITPDKSSRVFIDTMLQSEGINQSDYNEIKHSFNIHDLLSGKVDVMSSYISTTPYLFKKEGLEPVIFDPKDFGFNFYSDILFTSDDEVKYHPLRVQRFKEASLKGWRYAFKNIEESVDLILGKYNIQNKTKEELIFEAKVLKELAYYKTDDLGDINFQKLQNTYDIYNLLGHIKNKIKINDMIFKSRKTSSLFNEKLFTKKELQWINQHPSIKVSNELDYPPFDFAVEGVPKGYSIDLLNLISKKINIELEYVNGYTWNELVELFKEKKLDLLHSLTKTKKRQEYGLYSEPIIRYKTYIFTNQKDSHVKNIEQLYGKTIVVGKGWSIEDYLATNHPKINLLRVDNVEQMLLAVSKGKADAMINDKYSTLYDIKRFDIDNIIQSSWFGEFDNNEFKSYHFMGQKNAPELISILNKALTTITQEEIEKLHQKWFGLTEESSTFILTKQQKAYLEDKGQITMCIDPDWMPYEKFDKNGNHVGLSSDYFKIFQKKLNVPIRLIQTNSWSESLEFARKRKCDILSLAMETPIRKQYMNFTNAYLNVPLVLATKNEVSFISDFNQIANKKIGLVEGYAFNEILKDKYPELDIVDVKNIKDGLQQVVNNKLFGFIGSMADIGYIFQKDFVGELKIAGKFDEKWELGVGVRNDDLILLDIFQKLVDNISESEHQTIFNKYIAIKYEKGTDYTLLWQISILFFMILAIVIFFSIRQNRLKNELNTIFEQSLNPILLLDIETQKFIKFNQEALKMYGYTEEEFRNITTLDLSAEFTDSKKMKQKQKEILEKGFDEFTSRHKTRNGEILDVFMKTQVLDTNNKKLFYVTVDDISKQVENEKAIMNYQKNLEIKVKEEVEKNRAKDKTINRQSKLAAMGEMIGNIAHQWRQPLNRINLSLAVIDDVIKEQEIDKKIIEDKIQTAQKNLQYMSDTIEDFAKFFRPDKEMAPFVVKNVIKKSIQLLGNRLDSIELNISDCSIVIKGYENEFLQVLLVLLNNAVDNFIIKKVEQPKIDIEVKEKEKTIEILICDNGGGIEQDHMDKIFDPYFTTKFKDEGIGIGLYMAKMIIEDSMQGRLSVTSHKKQTTFIVEIEKNNEK